MFSSYASQIKGLMAAGLMVGALSQAQAAPVFTVDPSALGSNASQFNATYINGTASTLLNATSANTVQGQGYTQFTSFSNDGQSLRPATTGLFSTYDLYAVYTFTAQLTSGTALDANSAYSVTSLTYTLYGDILGNGSDATYTAANANSASSGTVTGGDQTVLATGSLVIGGANAAAINDVGGTSLNTQVSFNLTAIGQDYFTSPDPFYTFVFSSFTNTSQGVERNGNFLAINNAGGGADFNGQPNNVPEPGSIALIGLGLVGLAAARRRKTRA